MIRILWLAILVPSIIYWVPDPWRWMWVGFIGLCFFAVLYAALLRAIRDRR